MSEIITSTSDRRFKKDIHDFTAGLEEILGIHPVTYHFNELSGYDTDKEYIGVIAQELQQVAPYMVGSITRNGTEYLTVDNSAMTFMLINAVKELYKENQQLKEEIEAVKSQIVKVN